jgi:oxaloacetate decarboxylase gamma subunit
MTISEMLGQSGTMAIIGMGIVFSFLLVLIISVSLMGKIMAALGLTKEDAPQTQGGRVPAAVSQTAIVAAIGAAVTQYRKDT